MAKPSQQYPPLPPDDLNRGLALAQLGNEQTLPHNGLVGDTYTVTVSGEETAGRFCVIDMHIPPGGGPPPHRHDFEETFILLEGEIERRFEGRKSSSEQVTRQLSLRMPRTGSGTFPPNRFG